VSPEEVVMKAKRRLAPLFKRYMGSKAQWAPAQSKGVTVTVRIEDIRESYGRIDFLIAPLAGTGECWVQDSTLGLDA
jgi:hypothetical protein